MFIQRTSDQVTEIYNEMIKAQRSLLLTRSAGGLPHTRILLQANNVEICGPAKCELSNKKLLETSATLVVTGALLVVTRKLVETFMKSGSRSMELQYPQHRKACCKHGERNASNVK